MSYLRLSIAIPIIALSATFALRISANTFQPKDDRIVRATSAASVALAPEFDALRHGDPGPSNPRGRPAHLADLPNGVTQPAPGWRETQPLDPDGSAAPEQRVLTIDRATGKIYEQDLPGLNELLRPYTDAGIGLQELLDDPENVPKNFSDWTYVGDPTAGYFPRIVKLKMWARATDGILYGPYGCSGTLIDPMHVLTAAHCIWFWDDEDNGRIFRRYIEEVLVLPSYEDGDAPFGHAQWSQMHVWGNWSNDHDYDHDVGVIDLDRPIGALTGWWGYGYNEDCDDFESEIWQHIGYPGEITSNGEFMFQNSGDFDDCYLPTYKRVAWNNFSGGGTSGSGTLRTLTGAVYGAHSTGTEDHSTDCVLTEFKFANITQMISDDKPVTLDLHALDVNSQGAVDAGERPDHFNFAVLNYSHATGGGDRGFYVYLSDDTIITSIDTYLGSYAFNHFFGDNSAVRVDMLAPLIPADTPSGDYYLGVLLTDVDANIANNASNGQDARPITVTCPPSLPPDLVGPHDGATCLGPDVYFSWTPVAPLAGYQLEIDCNDCVSETIETQQTWHIRYGLQHNTTYWWRVRSMAQCGEWGDWSGTRLFTTEPDPDVVVLPQSPADGEHCVDPVTIIRWEPFFNAMGYEFRIGNNCGDGPVQPTTNAYVGVALPAGMEYNWMVRAQTPCGDWTNWSPCYAYKTTPTWVAAPVQTFPIDGTACVPADPRLNWADDPDVASWDVQVGTECGSGTILNATDHHLNLFGLPDGVTFSWRVRANHECGLVSAWTGCWSFSVDDVAPAPPANLVPSHPVAQWSSDNTIYVDWPASGDNCEPPGYSYVFDQSPTTIPDDVNDVEEPGTVSDPLPDGQDHWFHVKAVDGAGNASDTVHLGPFWIDATAPLPPQFDYTTIDPDQVFGVALLTADWSPVSDATSGVAGYSWWLDIDPAPQDQPDLVVDLTELTLTLELEYAGDLWFFLRSIDTAGNGSDVVALGPFTIDHDWLGVAFQSPTRADVLTEGDVFPVAWWLYDDGSAVPQMGRLEYSLDAGATFQLIGNLTPALLAAETVDWTVPAIGSDEAVLRLSAWDTVSRVVRARSERFVITQVSDVSDETEFPTDRIVLRANQPNPFNPQTTIAFELPVEQAVSLCVYDIAGRLINILVNNELAPAGRSECVWRGRDMDGNIVSAGVYFYRLEARAYAETKRMALIK